MKKLMDMTQETDNILTDIVEALSKKFKGTRILSNGAIESDVKYFIDTGLTPLNKVLGNGLPSGKMIEIYGKESSGKTTLVQYLIAQANAQGSLAIYVDGEASLEKNRAEQLKMIFDKILYHAPDSLEEAFNYVKDTIELLMTKKLKKPVLICLDSLASFPTEADLDGDIGDLKVGGSSRVNAQAMRVLTGMLAKCNATLLMINQVRDNPGVIYGEKESTPGGRAVKFHAHIRLKISKKDFIEEGIEKDDKDDDKEKKEKTKLGKVIGIVSVVEAKKNKVAPPFRTCTIPIYFNRESNCVDNAESVFEYLKANKIIEKEGRTFSYKDFNFTRKTFEKVYLENKELFDKAVMEY